MHIIKKMLHGRIIFSYSRNIHYSGDIVLFTGLGRTNKNPYGIDRYRSIQKANDPSTVDSENSLRN